VYTARYEGSDVAVKVRRPKIESLVEADLRTIRWSIPLVRKFTGSGRAFSLENLADEFAKTIREEMDYNRERAMLEEIRANFADEDRIGSRPPSRQSPARACSRWSIYPGTKISDVDALDDAGHDRNAIAETLQDVYLQMIIDR